MILQLLCVVLFGVVIIQANPISTVNSGNDSEVSEYHENSLVNAVDHSKYDQSLELPTSNTNYKQLYKHFTAKYKAERCESLRKEFRFTVDEVINVDANEKAEFIRQLLDEMELICNYGQETDEISNEFKNMKNSAVALCDHLRAVEKFYTETPEINDEDYTDEVRDTIIRICHSNN